jgi:hypothetical protein
VSALDEEVDEVLTNLVACVFFAHDNAPKLDDDWRIIPSGKG